MGFLKQLVQNTNLIIAFALGGVTIGGAILILSEQVSENNYYLTKANLTLSESLELNQKLMVIQDSMLRIDNQIFKLDSMPSQQTRLISDRIALMQYYILTSQQLNLLLVSYDLGMDKKLQDHYYSKYKSFFNNNYWDKGGYGADDGDMPNIPDLPDIME